MRVKFKKKGDVHSHPEWRNVNVQCLRLVELLKLLKDITKKFMFTCND